MPNSSASAGRRAFLGAIGGGGLAATAGCLDAEWARAAAAEEPLDVVVRFEGVADPDALGGDAIQRLKAHARRSHGPFRRFATRTPGVELRREFWIADAALARVDPDAVSLAELAAVEGVTELHPNVARGEIGDSLGGPGSTTEGGEVEGEGVGSGPDTAAATSETTPTGSAPATAGGLDATTKGAVRADRQQDEPEVAYGVEQLHANAVWQFYDARGEGVDVAVLDSGVDPSGHEGIATALERGGWAEFDSDGERVESEPNDPIGHGTGSSGLVVGGATDDGVRYGVAPEAALHHAKIVGEDGIYVAAILAGLEWAIEREVDVVSMSLGPSAYPSSLVEPFANARASGVLVVGAVGNAGRYTSACPGNHPDVVGVGAVDSGGTVAPFSGGERIRTRRYWGESTREDWPEEYTVPDVTAAGVDVPSAEAGGSYGQTGGASAAAPHVAGAAALALSAARSSGTGATDVDALERALLETAMHPDQDDDFAVAPGKDDRYGTGVVSALFAASQLLAQHTVSGTVTQPDGSPLAGASVLTETGPRTRTDEAGRFELELPPGEQPIGAFAPGYDADVAVVDPASTEDVELTPQPNDDPHLELVQPFPDRIDPDGAATGSFTVANVDTITVDVTTEVLLQPDALGLRVGGDPAEFGEPIEIERDGRVPQLSVTVEGSPDARVGTFTLAVGVDGDGERMAGQLGEVRVHPDPLPIGPEAPSLQSPIDVVAPGTTIELGDATFEESIGGGSSALALREPISLHAADGASPRIEIQGGDPETPAIYVGANDVELAGVEIEADGAAAGVQIGTEPRDRETDAPSGVTIRGVTIGGAETGIDVRTAPAAWIEDAEVTAEDVGITVTGMESVHVRGTDVHDVETGMAIDGLVAEITDNHLRSIGGTAIRLGLTRERLDRVGVEQGPIRNNVIEGATVGVEVADGAAAGEVEDNEFRNVGTTVVGLDGAGPGETDSMLHLVLYGATGLSFLALLVPYARRRLSR